MSTSKYPWEDSEYHQHLSTLSEQKKAEENDDERSLQDKQLLIRVYYDRLEQHEIKLNSMLNQMYDARKLFQNWEHASLWDATKQESKLHQLIPEQIVLRWLNYQLRHSQYYQTLYEAPTDDGNYNNTQLQAIDNDNDDDDPHSNAPHLNRNLSQLNNATEQATDIFDILSKDATGTKSIHTGIDSSFIHDNMSSESTISNELRQEIMRELGDVMPDISPMHDIDTEMIEKTRTSLLQRQNSGDLAKLGVLDDYNLKETIKYELKKQREIVNEFDFGLITNFGDQFRNGRIYIDLLKILKVINDDQHDKLNQQTKTQDLSIVATKICDILTQIGINDDNLIDPLDIIAANSTVNFLISCKLMIYFPNIQCERNDLQIMLSQIRNGLENADAVLDVLYGKNKNATDNLTIKFHADRSVKDLRSFTQTIAKEIKFIENMHLDFHKILQTKIQPYCMHIMSQIAQNRLYIVCDKPGSMILARYAKIDPRKFLKWYNVPEKYKVNTAKLSHVIDIIQKMESELKKHTYLIQTVFETYSAKNRNPSILNGKAMTLFLRHLGLEFDVCHGNETLLSEFESIVTQKVKAKYFATFLTQVCWIKMRMKMMKSKKDDPPKYVSDQFFIKTFAIFLNQLWIDTKTAVYYKQIVETPYIQQHLKKWNLYLWRLYKTVASTDERGITTIRFKDFSSFVDACALHLKKSEIEDIYQTANGNFECLKWNKKLKMDFDSFTQALIVICAKKDANIYLPLNYRIVNYLKRILKAVLKADV